jgi:hypothetical protein
MQTEIRSARGDSMMHEIPLEVWGRLNETGLINAMLAGGWFEMNVGGLN